MECECYPVAVAFREKQAFLSSKISTFVSFRTSLPSSLNQIECGHTIYSFLLGSPSRGHAIPGRKQRFAFSIWSKPFILVSISINVSIALQKAYRLFV